MRHVQESGCIENEKGANQRQQNPKQGAERSDGFAHDALLKAAVFSPEIDFCRKAFITERKLPKGNRRQVVH